MRVIYQLGSRLLNLHCNWWQPGSIYMIIKQQQVTSIRSNLTSVRNMNSVLVAVIKCHYLEGIYRPDSQGPSLNYVLFHNFTCTTIFSFQYSCWSSVLILFSIAVVKMLLILVINLYQEENKTKWPRMAPVIRINTVYKLFAGFWILLVPGF